MTLSGNTFFIDTLQKSLYNSIELLKVEMLRFNVLRASSQLRQEEK